MAIKLIVSDVDGTLVNTPVDYSMHERVKAAIDAAMAKGVKFAIASGRPYSMARHYVELTGSNAPTICNNGSDIVDASGVLKAFLLPVDFVRQCAQYALDHPEIFFMAGREEGLVCLTTGDNARDLQLCIDLGIDESDARKIRVFGKDEIPELLEQKIRKVIFLEAVPGTLGAFRREWEEKIASGEAGYSPYVASSFPNNFEFMPEGISKGSSMLVLADMLGIAREEIMAVGDGENDMEMIRMAGLGVAMGNANDEVRSAADYVTDSVADDGLAAAIERFVLHAEK